MVKINDIRKSFGGNKVLKGISLQGNGGQCIGIVGTNGSGKSTLLSIIAGIRKADSGTIEICGKDISKKPRHATEYIGYIPQENPVFPDLSVKDNLMLWYSDSKVTYEQAVSGGVIEMLGLTPILSQKVKTLSGGMRKRLSIAMALISEPEILFLDEPTLGLDVLARSDLWDLIRSLKGKVTIILTTHYMEEAETLSDRIAIMKDGMLLVCDAADKIKETAGTDNFEQAFIRIVKGVAK